MEHVNPFTGQTLNSFCPTGTGGGIDPTCSSSKSSGKIDPAVIKKTIRGLSGQKRLVAIADLVVQKYPGTEVTKAYETNSVYLLLPGTREQIRLSDHSKYGIVKPSHIHRWSSAEDLSGRLDKAIRYVTETK